MSSPNMCPLLGCIHADLTDAQRAHGICSVLDCDQPIQGWCANCRIQVCAPLHGGRDAGGTFVCQHCRWRRHNDHEHPSSPPL